MNDKRINTIRVEDKEGDSICLSFPWDSDPLTWIKQFRTILYWATFSPETIEEYLPIEENITDPVE